MGTDSKLESQSKYEEGGNSPALKEPAYWNENIEKNAVAAYVPELLLPARFEKIPDAFPMQNVYNSMSHMRLNGLAKV